MSDKKSYVDKMLEHVKVWDQEIAHYQKMADEASEEIRNKAESQIAKMKNHRDNLQNLLQQAQVSSDESWSDIKSGLEHVWDDLKETYEKTRSRFSNDHQ